MPLQPNLQVKEPVLEEAWFRQRTLSHDDFADLDRLLELKTQQGVTVSVGLPTLNVADTIESILTQLHTLSDRHHLIDQLALIDSRSTDGTPEIAERLGVEVYFDDELLPSTGAHGGKGEALWKSLAALRGDIIVWLDSDIRNFHPRFFYGLLGPLLTYPEVVYVKPFYRRPLKVGEQLQVAGGGRVTELVARPLLNLLYPELSHVLQPLSGEHAGRREALESVPFFTGYAVEIGLLVDIVRTYGLMAFAQVNLDTRVHHNQPLGNLGKMSFAIIQAFFRLLEEDDKAKLLAKLSTVYNNARADMSGFEESEIQVARRPPMKSVEEYRTQQRSIWEATC